MKTLLIYIPDVVTKVMLSKNKHIGLIKEKATSIFKIAIEDVAIKALKEFVPVVEEKPLSEDEILF